MKELFDGFIIIVFCIAFIAWTFTVTVLSLDYMQEVWEKNSPAFVLWKLTMALAFATGLLVVFVR